MDDNERKEKYESARLLVDYLLKPTQLVADHCWEMPRAQKDDSLFSLGFSLHFHNGGWLFPWRRKVYLEAANGRYITQITKQQAVYLIVEAPVYFTHALHWLRMSWPKDEFRMINKVV